MPEPLDVFGLPVHPAADEFPMLRGDELQALAADITANGLHHPLLVGKVKLKGADEAEWMLIDGRNRREACRIAGVEPTVQQLNGEDPVKRIWSENGPRRDMSKGAKAMVAACLFPEPEPGKRNDLLNNSTGEPGIDKASLSRARTVLALAPDLVDGVKAGHQSLADAYKTALDARRRRSGWRTVCSGFARSRPTSPIGSKMKPTS
jgi:ParB-like nuclease domain